MIGDIDIDAVERFESTLRKYKHYLERTNTQLADDFAVSKPTIELWLEGKNLPHIIIANGLVAFMNGKIKDYENGNNKEAN